MYNQKKPNTLQHSYSNVNKQMHSFQNAESSEKSLTTPRNGKKQQYKSYGEKKEQGKFESSSGNKYQNRKHTVSNPVRNNSKLQNKKDIKSSSIEYHFSDNNYNGETDNKSTFPYFSVEISVEKIRSIFDMLKEKFGESETIKEYSMYKNNDLILTVYPDGSSFCSQLVTREIKDPKISSGILVLYNEKYKLSNDNFPCQYIYNSIVDVVDVIFNVNNDIKIVLSTIYENNRNINKVKNIESLGRPTKLTKSKNAWCELYVLVDCNSKVEEVHDTINFLNLFFPVVTASQA
jgi:hypothetical protein